jgi:hypothetical protein
MDFAIELFVIGCVVPAVIATIVAGSVLRLRAGRTFSRWALPLAAAVGYAGGYLLLPDWAAIRPQRHWQWLPYLALAAAAIGPIGLDSRQAAWSRSLALTSLAVGAAYLLVPLWPNLIPPRPWSLVLVSVYLSALALAAQSLVPRLTTGSFLALLTLGAATVAGALAIDVVRYGQLAGMAAAVLFGCGVAVAISRPVDAVPGNGLPPLFAVLVGGSAYVGCVEPEPPRWWLLLLPALPLVLGPIVARFKRCRASANSAQ